MKNILNRFTSSKLSEKGKSFYAEYQKFNGKQDTLSVDWGKALGEAVVDDSIEKRHMQQTENAYRKQFTELVGKRKKLRKRISEAYKADLPDEVFKQKNRSGYLKNNWFHYNDETTFLIAKIDALESKQNIIGSIQFGMSIGVYDTIKKWIFRGK